MEKNVIVIYDTDEDITPTPTPTQQKGKGKGKATVNRKRKREEFREKFDKLLHKLLLFDKLKTQKSYDMYGDYHIEMKKNEEEYKKKMKELCAKKSENLREEYVEIQKQTETKYEKRKSDFMNENKSCLQEMQSIHLQSIRNERKKGDQMLSFVKKSGSEYKLLDHKCIRKGTVFHDANLWKDCENLDLVCDANNYRNTLSKNTICYFGHNPDGNKLQYLYFWNEQKNKKEFRCQHGDYTYLKFVCSSKNCHYHHTVIQKKIFDGIYTIITRCNHVDEKTIFNLLKKAQA
jgi:hypothetical protein